ncbi:MAG: hypothetical protein KA998_05610, partial [Rickettsiaceae bacterium]|nr:hypothetical protein [Rickettsiaceae bacterium]
MSKKLGEGLILICCGIIIGAIFWYNDSFQKKTIPNADYKILQEINYPKKVGKYSPQKSRADIKSFIKKQFDIYRKDGIDIAKIEALSNLPDNKKRKIGVCRVQIVNGKIYADTKYQSEFEYCSKFVDGLSRVLKKHRIGN